MYFVFVSTLQSKLHLRVREDLALQLFAGNRLRVLQLFTLQISPMHRLDLGSRLVLLPTLFLLQQLEAKGQQLRTGLALLSNQHLRW